MNPQHQQKRKICQSCCLKLYLRPSFIAFFNFSHKRPTFAFTVESGYTHSPSPTGSHTTAHTAKQGAFRTGTLSLPSTRAARSRTSPGRVSDRRTLPLLGLDPVCSRRTQRAFGTAMRLCASLFRGVAAPPGCVIPFSSLSKLRFVHPVRRAFPHVRKRGWYHYPRRAPCVVETLGGRLSKRLICHFPGSLSTILCSAPFLLIYRYLYRQF